MLIHNTSSGVVKHEALCDRVAKIFQDHGIRTDVHAIAGGRGIPELVQEGVRRGSFAVVAAGGDGTVSCVASGLVGSQTAMGVVPVGTLNHFAKDMHIPLDVAGAAHTIATGRFRAVDVGEVNGKFFVNNSSLGLYPSVVREREQEQRLGRSKVAALLWATLAALRHHPSASIRLVSDDGKTVTRQTPLVFIGNNRYEMNGLKIGSRPSLETGKLAVCVLHREGALSLLRMGVETVFGRLRNGVDFDFLLTNGVQIEVQRPQVQVAIDGEVSTFTPPLTYRIHPQALRVLVPDEEPSKAN
ncbi:MAG: diacylglycerol kinase family protein [Thermoanaerobaculia bacterium]